MEPELPDIDLEFESSPEILEEPVGQPDLSPESDLAVADDLEEELYAPVDDTRVYVAGEEIGAHTVTADLGRNWYRTRVGEDDFAVSVQPDPLWTELAAHRALPKVSTEEGLTVLTWQDGQPLRGPLSLHDALTCLTELARLAFALERQGFAMTDLDPEHLVAVESGVRLRLLPRVSRIGQISDPFHRDGFTPPEVMEQQVVGAGTSTYLLGALLRTWLEVDGRVPNFPGVPQLLHRTMAPGEADRARPDEILAMARALSAPPGPDYRVVGATTVGLNEDRPLNEDAFGYQVFRNQGHPTSLLTLQACVADGMGGLAAGEVASVAAVTAFLNSTDDSVEERVWEANAAVLADLKGQDGGCAFTGVLIRQETLSLGHVGDTRAYLAREGEVKQLSRDHSLVGALVTSGQITEAEAEVHPDRNVILRSLGGLRQRQEQYVQTLELDLCSADRVLIVSDGVWGQLAAEVLRECLLSTSDAQAVVDTLLRLTIETGAPDNATALLIEWVTPAGQA